MASLSPNHSNYGGEGTHDKFFGAVAKYCGGSFILSSQVCID